MNAGKILVSLLLGLSLAVPAAALPGEAWEGHLELGQELLEQKQFEAATTELEKVLSMAPGESIEALYALSRAYGQTGRAANAIAACRDFTGAAADPELAAKAHNLLGIWLLSDDSDLRGSRKAFKRALELSSEKAYRARLSLAEVLHRQGREKKALRVLRGYPQREPEDSWWSLPTGPVSDHVYDQLPELLLARDPETPLYFQGSIVKPQKVQAPPPVYTRIAHDRGIQGLVTVRTVIDREGNVVKVRLLKGLPYGLSKQAVESIKGWKFKPATFRGRPVALYYNLTVNFRLS